MSDTPDPLPPLAAPPVKRRRGFAAMTSEQHRQIAALGGRTAHGQNKAHRFSFELAREAGTKGGQRVSADRDHMARIGRNGGKASAVRRAEQPQGESMTYKGMKHDDGWPEHHKHFGPLLRAVRELTGLSRQSLAYLAGISWATLRNIEAGMATAPDKRARLLAVLSEAADPDAPPTLRPEGASMSPHELKVLGPYPYRSQWRLVLCLGSERSSRSYDSRKQAEAAKARLLKPPTPKEEPCP